MSHWLNRAVSRAEQVSDWLSPQRQISLALLREAQWPTRKTEAWKYTPVHLLADADFATAANSELSTAETITVTDRPTKSNFSLRPEVSSHQEVKPEVINSY